MAASNLSKTRLSRKWILHEFGLKFFRKGPLSLYFCSSYRPILQTFVKRCRSSYILTFIYFFFVCGQSNYGIHKKLNVQN